LYGLFWNLNLSREFVPYTPILKPPDPFGIKPPLMNSRTIINRSIILSVFVIAGYLLARSFYYGSFIGIVLALVAIAAWSVFLYKLNKMQTENDTEEVSESY
jgi:hypothetical protein